MPSRILSSQGKDSERRVQSRKARRAFQAMPSRILSWRSKDSERQKNRREVKQVISCTASQGRKICSACRNSTVLAENSAVLVDFSAKRAQFFQLKSAPCTPMHRPFPPIPDRKLSHKKNAALPLERSTLHHDIPRRPSVMPTPLRNEVERCARGLTPHGQNYLPEGTKASYVPSSKKTRISLILRATRSNCLALSACRASARR